MVVVVWSMRMESVVMMVMGRWLDSTGADGRREAQSVERAGSSSDSSRNSGLFFQEVMMVVVMVWMMGMMVMMAYSVSRLCFLGVVLGENRRMPAVCAMTIILDTVISGPPAPLVGPRVSPGTVCVSHGVVDIELACWADASRSGGTVGRDASHGRAGADAKTETGKHTTEFTLYAWVGGRADMSRLSSLDSLGQRRGPAILARHVGSQTEYRAVLELFSFSSRVMFVRMRLEGVRSGIWWGVWTSGEMSRSGFVASKLGRCG